MQGEGCAICGATWGNYWEEVADQKRFFCCEICAIEFRNVINEVKKRTGWKTIDEIAIKGDYRGRIFTATSGDKSRTFLTRFGASGEIHAFLELNK